MDFYGFYTGQIFDAHQWLGAHIEGKQTVFRTFAPAAKRVELYIHDVAYEMKCIHDGNFYEVTVSDIQDGDSYYYKIWGADGKESIHSDPFGFGMELRPKYFSIVRDLKNYKFQDKNWMQNRKIETNGPLNIYEMHLGSWKKKGNEQEDWYHYDELIPLLIPYLKENGYNYVEFMPISEHPCDESWGYQNTGFFSPTSRYGTARQLKMLIDALHKENIGVILDFVPVHFAVDQYGLAKYDGTYLYEYPHSDVGVSEWGSCNFMHSRGEVRSLLQSAANYWLEEFHFDGIRMDAISRIIYWQGDERRGVNKNAVDFIKFMNVGLKKRNPHCILIAEDSTNFANITKSVEVGGLGFDYKWDLGWMHDTLNFFATPVNERKYHYHKLTFSMMYFYNEHYLLPFSHDEVVHGKATIVQKMFGNYDEKFAQARALYLYMMLHPGKKLNFMGNEIGHMREWDEKREQDWNLLDFPIHDHFHHYIMELNQLYLSHPAFWEKDYETSGFSWIDCDYTEDIIYSMKRSDGKETLIGLFNFSDQCYRDYTFSAKSLPKILLNTDRTDCELHLRLVGELVHIDLPPFSGLLLS